MAPDRIPPPFREVTSDEGDAFESSTRGSYQTRAPPPKSLLAAAPWRTGAPAVTVEPDGAVRALVRPADLRREFVLLPPYSPARRYQPPAVRRLKKLGSWSRDGAALRLTLEPDVLGNGVRGATLSRVGDVVEFAGEEWVLAEGDEPLMPAPGPLARALAAGTARLDGGRLLVGPGPFDSARDSLERLRRVLSSDWATSVSELVIHAWSSDPAVSWERFVATHHALAASAPIPVQVVDARGSLSAQPAVEPGFSPWGLIATTGEARPLTRTGPDWALELGERLLQWNVTPEGARQRLTDGALDALVPWFTATFAGGDEGVVLLPGPSPFFAGRAGLPDDVPLSPSAVRVLVDQLVESGDVAGPLLASLTAQPDEHASHEPLERLLAPWVIRSGLGGRGIDLARSEHVCGFFTSIEFEAWPDFHLDVPALLRHPLLVRLRRIRFSSRLPEATLNRVRACHPVLQIVEP